ncbi:unnamed protein product [Rotaria sp. Silwood2]|nr:unnamed protein product [Rotaria sp. Silwood2]
MEVDSNCVFVNVGNCDGSEIPCHDFLKPHADTDNHSSLLGCKTQIENLLLQYGKFDMLPCNLEEFHVCNNHSNLIYSTRFKSCCLCKPFDRSKFAKSGLRIITKLYGSAAWKKSQVRLSFGRKMCTQCRHDLDKFFMKEELKQECDAYFQWLYDVNVIHTPSIFSPTSCHILSQSFNNLVVEEKQELLKQFLQGNSKKYKLYSLEKPTISLLAEIKCFDPLSSTNSFVNLQSPSLKRFCRQSTKILKKLLDMLTPHDDIDLVWQTIVENYKQTSQSVDTLDKNFCLVLTSLTEAYNNAQHWTVRRQI